MSRRHDARIADDVAFLLLQQRRQRQQQQAAVADYNRSDCRAWWDK
jgi:hypothetical protein